MSIPSVDLTTLNNLSPNLDIGDIADPALRLQAFQYLYNKLTEAVADLNAFQVGGAIKTVNLADGNVVTVKLADNAVTGPKILDGAIITAKLADGNVTTLKIADGNITRAKLADKVVGAGQLDDAAVGQSHHQDNGIPSRALPDNVILQRHMSDNSVGSAEIQAGAVQNQHLANGVVDANKIASSLLTNYGDIAVQAEFDKRGINVQKYGARGDGIANDTAAIQSAFNAGNTYIPDGTYMIDAVTKLQIPSNRTIEFSPNAVFKVIPNGSDSYRVLEIFGTQNITIVNPTIIGERGSHSGSTGEFGHGIVISGKNIKIYNPTLKDCWGDGLYVFSGENVYIENIICDNNRRNNISIVSAKNFTIEGGLVSNAKGTMPQCGIDIEPNVTTDVLENIKINNVTTSANDYYGILIQPQLIMDTAHQITIEINHHKDYGSRYGFCFAGCRPTVQQTGRIMINNPYYQDNTEIGLGIQDYQSQFTPPLLIKNPTIVNTNPAAAQPTVPRFGGTGILLTRETTYAGTQLMGNVTIENPVILDTRSVKRMLRGIYFYDGKTVGYENTLVLNPIRIDCGFTDNNFKIDGGNVAKGIKVVDSLEATKLDTTIQFNSVYNGVMSKFINTGATVKSQINLQTANTIENSMEFVNTTTFGLMIIPPAGINILPVSAVAGKYIETTQVGASIKIRKLNANSYIAERMQGTWTVQA